MTGQARRTHARGDESRRAILDATLKIAAERGYVGTTVAEVKKATGLPASSLYWHFKDKDELLSAALDHGFARWHEVSPRWEGDIREDDLAASLASHFAASTDGLDEEPGFWRMGLLLALETGPAVGSGARDRFLTIRAGADEVLRTWWGHVVPPDHQPLLARITLAALDGLFIAHQSDDPDLLDAIVPMLAEGIAQVAEQLATGTLHPQERTARAHSPAGHGSTAPATGRDKLLAAAAQVAAESGYEGASISRICTRAGLPASSLYWHFKDKDNLLAEVVEHSFREWTGRQPGWLPPAPGTAWPDALRSHLTTTLQSLHDESSFLRIGHQLLLLDRSPAPAGRARFVSVRRRQQLIMAQWFRDNVAAPGDVPERLALMVMVLWEGLFYSRQLDVLSWEPSAMADVLSSVISGALESVSA